MNRFWMNNIFIREYARDLNSHKAQIVYVALCCHCNAEGLTFIGCRKIAKLLNINKETVSRAIKYLEVYGLVRRLEQKMGRATVFKIHSVRIDTTAPSYPVAPKEYNKENIKDETNHTEQRGRELMLDGIKMINPKLYESFKNKLR